MATFKCKLVSHAGPAKGHIQVLQMSGPLRAGSPKDMTTDTAWWHGAAIADSQRRQALASGAPDPEVRVESIELVDPADTIDPQSATPPPGGRPIDLDRFANKPKDDADDE